MFWSDPDPWAQKYSDSKFLGCNKIELFFIDFCLRSKKFNVAFTMNHDSRSENMAPRSLICFNREPCMALAQLCYYQVTRRTQESLVVLYIRISIKPTIIIPSKG